jgi:PAS domain S-box-containing protein
MSADRRAEGAPSGRRLERRTVELEALATEREELAARLREIEDRYQRLTANIPGMIYTFALDSEGNPRFPYVSSSSRELFGLEPEEIMRDGSLIPALRHPDDVERVDRAMRRSAADLRPFRIEIRHVVDGEVRWHDCISRPVRLPDGSLAWDGIIMDTTERNRAESARRESEERFRTVVEHAVDALFLATWPEGRIVDVNQSACDSLGYSREELLSMSFFDFDVELDPRQVEESYETAELHAGRSITHEGLHQRKDGSCFPVEVKVGTVKLEGRLMALALARDVTERERTLQDLEKKNAELERYAYTIAHDLRNPLVTISVFTGALLQYVARGELDRLEPDLERVDKAAKEMQRLLDDLESQVGKLTGLGG